MAIPSRTWRRWHRWLGLGIALPVVLLAVTGLLLNHGDFLGLSSRVLPPWLAAIYGMPRSAPVHASVAGEDVWLFASDVVHSPGGRQIPCRAPFKGAVPAGEVTVIGCADELLVLDRDGQELERVDSAWGVPAFDRIGISPAAELVLAEQNRLMVFDLSDLRAEPFSGPWQAAEVIPAPAVLAAALPQAAVPPEFNWERLLLDLHSGRILGTPGRWLMDIAALLLLVLALTGVVIWSRTRP